MFSRIADQYRGSTAVVVGAGGIGGEIIRLLSASVGRLIVADHNEALLAEIAGKYDPAKVVMRKLDVSNSAAVADFATFLSSTGATPHYLFFAVGILTIEPFLATKTSDWDRAIAINLNGAFYCVKAISDLMVPQRRGSILLLGSIAGTKARSGSRVNPVYNVTKAGVSAFVNATAMQLRKDGIRINCISPGPTATSMMDIQPAAVHASVRDITLDQRMNSPTEVAELALFVAAHGRFTGEDVGLGGGAGLGG